jgi:hypothetical protein
MRAAGQDYLYEGESAMQAAVQMQSCLLLTGITAYWHVWRPAVRGQERWRAWGFLAAVGCSTLGGPGPSILYEL